MILKVARPLNSMTRPPPGYDKQFLTREVDIGSSPSFRSRPAYTALLSMYQYLPIQQINKPLLYEMIYLEGAL